MYVKEVTVENQVGLHARPATFFIQKANEYKSSIWVEKEERRVNAKSLLGVLSLGIVGGTTIRIIADGTDAQAAVGDWSPAFFCLRGHAAQTKNHSPPLFKNHDKTRTLQKSLYAPAAAGGVYHPR